ncbi:amino acid ABC transporter ATP-binding protein [Weissella cibaria]|jgi:ABC-type polar amino acid transport system, ATPase component|uniref:Amino acid ABC transporter ATP-binding protein n=2 Tax=Weissella TaxID=46255 RepID=A0A0D1LWD1_9LACO|nr:ATP-binding cassette domain-containing protein [Weissella cibaria]AVO67489.1 amino acid ABC transporter ATP-binding protein [Weissella cibaria]AWF96145.1 Arginine transport ATP-binding protein ArtM [Weissella cibaria]KIU20196.1 Arginine transport ATP-binding protein ArtM [Weissella cibaria]MBU7545237.1 amino acid ABC transporter ATP-binding protein [Weissella cibaria]MBZ5942715.1 ATP-binding cassette domain-containing protein [Weissella cibaria]
MLEIKNLAKSYDTRTIFKNMNLTVNDGEVLSIVGPSGIGKTTFLRIVAGLLPANDGEMILNGEALDLTGDRTGAQVGVIFQDFNLFPQYTVKENVMLAPQLVHHETKAEAAENADRLLQDLGLTAQADQYPFQLSGGQKQRVAIARALAMKPGILAYDEPTSGLDAESTERVIAVIKQLQAQGVTQLVVTHDLPFAEAVADKTFDFGTDVER